MRHDGRITDWNDDRGFGFVTTDADNVRAFVHVNDFNRVFGRPDAGMLISCELRKDAKGRLTAKRVRALGRKRISGKRWARAVFAVLCAAALVIGWRSERLPTVIAFVYGAMSVLAIILYAADKRAAVRNRWRTQESTLHFVALAGGWPGAAFAQAAFRHKSKKAAFQAVFWITVALNCAALAWLLVSGNAVVINQTVFDFLNLG